MFSTWIVLLGICALVLKFMYSMLPSGCMGFRSIDHLCMLRMCSKHAIIVVPCCIQLHIVNYNERLYLIKQIVRRMFMLGFKLSTVCCEQT